MSSPNTNPLTYNSYISQIADLAVVGSFTPPSNVTIGGVNYLAGITYGGSLSSPDTAFNTLIPQMLNYAELRIQRDLDILPTQVTNTSYSLSSGSNLLSISINDFVTLQTVSIQSGTATIPLLSTTKEFLQNVYNDSSSTGQPQYFAVYGGDSATFGNTYQNIVVGPYPDQNYPVLLIGTVRMPSLYQYATVSNAGTSTTFISTYLPDLLIQASMIYISQYQRNFGPASNDPQMGTTYEMQYQTLLRGAMQEEYRKKFEAAAWSSMSSSPVATPTAG